MSSKGDRQRSIYKKDSTPLVLKFNNDGTLNIAGNGELKANQLWSISENGDYLFISDPLLGEASNKKLKIMKLSKKELVLYNEGPNQDFQVKVLLSFKKRPDNDWTDKSVDFRNSLN